MSALNNDEAFDQTLLLRGLFPLSRLIRFVRERCPAGQVDESVQLEQWRQAKAVALALASDEAGHADDIGVQALPDDLQALGAAALRQPSMHRITSLVPRSWCMVEVDRLVVFQESINLRYLHTLKERVASAPDERQIMELATCLGEQAHPEVRHSQADGDHAFASTSNDLRFLDVAVLDPSAIAQYTPFGTASHAVVIYLGFSDNVISATRVGRRLILTNGSHRAYLLRSLGFRYIPCLVTDASDSDTSEILLPAAVKQERDFYLRAARPPLFKDYSDPRLTQIVPTLRRNYVLRAKLDLKRTTVPAV
ncbi:MULTISPECIES: hypothetical protein [Xanthomonas]|uniref:Uncharacterized protein n=1 Tax=Xanthomonas cucurbitae TaxID=56453 RepID=A0ABY7YHD8_9XANT|nr:hypothetical protein [Xanthomonas cucurbitae]WDM69428.1 hypothetical protein K6981_09490 [Xanthomonas cucurbitae]WDM73301.1 hypothetical protein K6978_09460 [Xanthomonas cucurbitae]WDM74044.1 hypothetical protein K6982_11365 [Xanthomonas cucurbitae]